MAASHNLPQSLAIRQIPKHGTLTLYGFGIKVRVQSDNLEIDDGMGMERRNFRLPRVNHGLRRLVMIGSDGFITLEALRWVSDVGASFLMLDRRGKVIVVCGPTSPSDAKLRRAQALALGNGVALKISKELISQKLAGQGLLVRDMLHDSSAADAIGRFRAVLPSADSIEVVRLIESQAARAYWQVWSDVPICWPRKDERRVPEHWKRFGSRISPLTHSPRLAANPPNAILNYLYAILEAEARLAASAMGLDPGIGFLHADAPKRDSLACDLMEVCRPRVDAFVLNWLQSEPFRRSDFWEDRNGNCRLVSALAIQLSQTAETWRKFVAPVAEYVAQDLWVSISRPPTKLARQLIATRLTQRNKRQVKGSDVPAVNQPKPEHVCGDCGAPIRSDKKLCSKCAKAVIRVDFRAGRKSAQKPEFLAKRSATQRRHIAANRAWNPSSLPSWLNKETYVKKIQPALSGVTQTKIASTLGVSWPYAKAIHSGQRIPHMRHWSALSKLAGVSAG